jgi:hypothetical protein
MPLIPPTNRPTSKSTSRSTTDSGRSGYRTPPDANAALFSPTGKQQTLDDPRRITRRMNRGARIAGDMKRAIFFTVVLVFVGVVLYQFVTATAL